MPADIVTKPSAAFPALASIKIETKADLALATSWVEKPGLRARRLATRVNGFDQLVLSYKCGDSVRHQDEATPAWKPLVPLDLAGQYVRLTLGTDPDDYEWVGIVVDDQVTRGSVFVDAADADKRKYRKRDQQLVAYSLDYLLDRRQIVGSVIYDTQRIDRPIRFNGGSTSPIRTSRDERGNRQQALNSDSLAVFEDGMSLSSEWSAADIIKYLLKYFGPVDDVGDPLPAPFVLDSAAETLLADYKPALDAQGLTVYQAINAILNPRRGFCWWVEYQSIPAPVGEVKLFVESLADTAIVLPTGGNLPANTRQKSLDFDLDPTVKGAAVKKTRRTSYNRVRCRGARMTSTFTVGFGDSTLAADWGSQLLTAYKDAAKPAEAGPELDAYNALSDDEKKKRNDAYRRRELLQRVFTCFRIPAAWDKKCGDGGAADPPVARNWAFADTESTGSILGGLAIHIEAIRVLAQTLLKSGVDYTDPSNQVDDNPAGTEPDRVPPFALVKVATSPDKWQYVDKLTNSDFADGTAEGTITTSYHLRAQSNAPGLIVRAAAGPAHAIAKNHWTDAEPTQKDPELDYETLLVTLSAEADAHAEGVWPATAAAGEVQEELVVDLGDGYRLDFLPEHTVVDVKNGDLVKANASTNEGRLLRDDRKKLTDAARVAYLWYQTDRASLELALGQTRPLLALGQMITTIGEAETLETANTVIGEISYDFTGGTQTIRTLGDAIHLPSVLT